MLPPTSFYTALAITESGGNIVEKVVVKTIRDAIVASLEADGLQTTPQLKERISKALGIAGAEVETNIAFMQKKEKISQQTIEGKGYWQITKPKAEKSEIPKNYKEYRRKVVFTTPCLGTCPIDDAYWLSNLDEGKLKERLNYDGKTSLNIHEQRRCDGKYYIWTGWLRGLLRDGMYIVNGKPKTLAQKHMKIYDAEIHTNGLGAVTNHVSVGGGKQGGVVKSEAILPGAWAELFIRYPSNMISEQEIDDILETMGQSRGFGGNHSKGYGKFEIEP